MAKKGGAGGIGRPSDLLTTAQSDAWKQRLRVGDRTNSYQTEERITKHINNKAIEAFRDEMETRNTYLGYFKREETKLKDEEKKQMEKFAFDIVHDESERVDKKKRPREEPKQVMAVPATSAQTYGWLEPIDTMSFAPPRNALCKKTFYDSTHLS